MRIVKLVALATASALLAISTAWADPVANEFGPNLVVNGGFETNSFSGWTQSGNTSFTSISTGHSGCCGVLAGPTGTLGFISQDISTVAGEHYNIHFWLRMDDGTPNEFVVRWDGVEVFNLTNSATFGFTEFVIDPQATDSSTTLTFGFRHDPAFIGLDDISVFQTTAATNGVPEPATVVLLGLGLTGLMGLARRRRGPRP